jgi:hypothetical protein
MGKFSSKVVSWALKTNERAEGVLQEVALEGFKILKRRSPVKSSRYRANWRVGLNSPNTTVDVDARTRSKFGDEPNENELKDARRVLARAKVKDKVILSNSLPYAKKIELGLSQTMAPQGVVSLSHDELQARYPQIVGRFLTGRTSR